jgi:hypothetical protein
MLIFSVTVKHVAQSRRERRLLMLTTAMVAAGLVSERSVSLAAGADVVRDELIQRVVAQSTRAGVAVRAWRELRAGTRNGKYEGWMEVETTTTPTGDFSWTVLNEGGSDRVRKKVFRTLLDTESKSWHDGSREAAALTLTNYILTPLGTTRGGNLQIQLTARRPDSRLVNGILTVGPDGAPLLLEGALAKSPSFWVKSLKVVQRFGKVTGIALPMSLETTADVKLVGEATMTMQYRYREVNGRVLSDAVALAPAAPELFEHPDRK